mmetsp:Transcript_26838/g.48664  ORF Transcript_26838/g.48664 Transcript_26838/m.48664 type:complete len:569 (+) Transcript_26838:363-2069(+)
MRAFPFISASILLFGPLSCLGQCPNRCSNNGVCNGLVCDCASGFTGGDCSVRTCPSGSAFSDVAETADTAHLSTVCSGRGSCIAGNCACNDGFTGIACERTKCKGNCSYRGRCVSMQHLAETTRNHESQQYSYSQWDAEKIYGCICDLGYTGYDCSLRVCPSGDDPLTTSGTDQEIQLLRCTADSTSGGHVVLYFDGKQSASIHVDALTTGLKTALETIPVIEEVSITYSEGNVLCRNDGVDNIVRITFTSNFGPLPPIVAESFGMEPSSAVEIAADNSYGMLTDHNGIGHAHTKGDKENDECSNRGICDQGTGTCQCFDTNGDEYSGSDGYGNSGDRGDCGHALTSPITTCPGESLCSDRGVCDPTTLRCTCEEGFTGGDCSLRTCKKGLAWFGYPSSNDVAHDVEMECSNMGVCHRTVGECTCNSGFFGGACEFMGCVGEDSEKSCSGHGECLSMRELGLRHKDAGGSSTPISYGSDPNGAGTWDADRIFGCNCDDGFEGYDCSLRTCTVGVDPEVLTLTACSHRGVCDHDTGRCKCFRGWGSSDGSGSLGPNNDCGHRLKLRGYP